MNKVDIDIIKRLSYYNRYNNTLVCENVRHILFRVWLVTSSIGDFKSYVISNDGILAADIFKTDSPNKIKRLHRYRKWIKSDNIKR